MLFSLYQPILQVVHFFKSCILILCDLYSVQGGHSAAFTSATMQPSMQPSTFSVGICDTSAESINARETWDVFDDLSSANFHVSTPVPSTSVPSTSEDNAGELADNASSYQPSFSTWSSQLVSPPDSPDHDLEMAAQDQECPHLDSLDHSIETQDEDRESQNLDSDRNRESQELDRESPCHAVHPESRPTFKLVGDNIDKNVKPRDMRADHQTQSLHYFHSFAVKDRIDFSSVPNTLSLINPAEVDLNCCLPSGEDERVLDDNLCVLISRVVAQYMPFFKECASRVNQHIDHPYSKEMAQKSTVVCVYIYYI